MRFLYHNQNIRVEIPQFSSVSGLLVSLISKFFFKCLRGGEQKKLAIILFIYFSFFPYFYLFIYFFNFTILYWFCHTSTWIHHRYTHVPNPEPPSHLPPYIPLGHPSAPASSILYPASNLDWRFVSYMIVYMFQCHSPKSSPFYFILLIKSSKLNK